MKRNYSFALIALAVISASCKNKEVPVIETVSVKEITVSSVVCGGSVRSDGGDNITGYGVCWSKNSKPTIADSKTPGETGLDRFISHIDNLEPGTDYYVRAYATNGEGTGYGAAVSFRTLGQLPSAYPSEPTDITSASANLSAQINPNYVSTNVSFEFGTSSSYGNTVPADQSVISGNTKVPVTAKITSLLPGTVYHYRVKAVNSLGTTFSSDLTFTTQGCAPTVTTPTVSNITAYSISVYARVNPNNVSTTATFEFGTSTAYGKTMPATEGLLDGSTLHFVSTVISTLSPGTTYHIRLRTENSNGISYSDDLQIKTPGQEPSVSGISFSNMTISGVTITATVNANYVTTNVTFEYGLTPEFGDSLYPVQINGSSGVGVNAQLMLLSPGTVYYCRVKAENSLGTTYSNNYSFTTLGSAPTATASTPLIINVTSAYLDGLINPNYLITKGSFEYGKTLSYGNTVASSPENLDGTSSTVTANITGLEPGTVYHYRVKAVNSMGTAYSSNQTFTTKGQIPTAVTNPATHLLTSSTFLNGTVNANYLSTTVSFEYGTTSSLGSTIVAVQNPVTLSTPLTVNATINGLSAGITYYFRLKAENVLGTSYGSILTFVPVETPVSVTDADGNVYPVVEIGSQFWMAENLKTTKYNDNTDIRNVTDGPTWIALTSPGYCWYNNDEASYKDTYGALYNFYTVSTGKLCPLGWHIPSYTEFFTLASFLGDVNYAGGKLKETGTLHWSSPNTGATNLTGFTALPSGYRLDDGSFSGLGLSGTWWTSTQYYSRSVSYINTMFSNTSGSPNKQGLSVRCIKVF